MKKSTRIPTLNPLLFKKVLIEESNEHLLHKIILNDFFIHSLSNDIVNLKLPLPPHRKTVHDFVLITQGKMVRRLGIELYEIDRNSLFFAPAGSITTTEYISKDIDGYFCHFSDDFLAGNKQISNYPYFNTLGDKSPIQNVPEYSMKSIAFLLSRIVELFKSTSNVNLMREYLMTLFAEFEVFHDPDVRVNLTKHDLLTQRYRELVKKKFKSIHSIQEYSDILYVSPNHLNKTVKASMGKTASQYLKEYLILEAKVLLYQSDLSINEISMELGFNDVSYFGRFFKKNMGCSPSEFRKMIE